MKKLIIAAAVAVMAVGAYARPHGGYHHGGYRHHGGYHHSHHHGGYWGRGGRHFWPGFVGGVVGGIVYDAVTTYPRETVVVHPTPTVVTTPVVVQPAPTVVQPTQVVVQPPPVTQTRNVWVEGRYVDQVQANGTVIRVWQPGHYEQTTVVVQ